MRKDSINNVVFTLQIELCCVVLTWFLMDCGLDTEHHLLAPDTQNSCRPVKGRPGRFGSGPRRETKGSVKKKSEKSKKKFFAYLHISDQLEAKKKTKKEVWKHDQF